MGTHPLAFTTVPSTTPGKHSLFRGVLAVPWGEWACLLSLSSSPLLVQCCFAFFLLLMSLQNLVMSGGHPSGCLECTTVWTRIASVFSKDRCDSVNAAPVSIPPLTWPLHLLGGFQVP